MKVKELIKVLRTYDDEAEVWIGIQEQLIRATVVNSALECASCNALDFSDMGHSEGSVTDVVVISERDRSGDGRID